MTASPSSTFSTTAAPKVAPKVALITGVTGQDGSYLAEFLLDKGFTDLDAARAWAAEFVRWYNDEHRHSGIRYVTPGQRHCGEDHAILAARHALYLQARERNPARWSGLTRDWSPIGPVTLNPEPDSVVAAHSKPEDGQPMAA